MKPSVLNVGWCVCIEEAPNGLLVQRDDGEQRWVGKTSVSAASQVKRSGDRGFLILTQQAAEVLGWADRKRTG
jgi:hypothetical protein